MSLLLAGAGSSATVFTCEGTGGFSFGGSASTEFVSAAGAVVYTYEPSGGVTFSGNAATELAPASTGGSSGGGGGWISRTVGRAFSRATVVPVAKVFTHSPAGGISFGGAAPTSFTKSPRLRREEEVAMMFAMLG